MTVPTLEQLVADIQEARVVPYLGPAALAGATGRQDGRPIPATSDELILALNGGKPMAPKLMYEFPRAAMNLELKRGRRFLDQSLSLIYKDTPWTTAPLHTWLAGLNLPYLIDINRDGQLQGLYASRPHTLVVGVARLTGTHYRFRLFDHDGNGYREVEQEQVDTGKPVLFKPLGVPLPEPLFIASDADFVDYITELMGGFAIPDFLKSYRQELKYLLVGLRLTRDTERMVMADITYKAGGERGWALIPEPNAKERRFCQRLGFTVIEAGVQELLEAAQDLPCLVDEVL